MSPEPSALLLVVLGGFVGLDAVSCPQAMISRPVVAGPLAGFILGDPAAGVWAGLFLEILTLRQLPIGASRHWDVGPAAVASTAAAAGTSGGGVVLVIALALGVLLGWVGSWSVYLQRWTNARIVASLSEGGATAGELQRRHMAAMATDFTRAALLTALGVFAAYRIQPFIAVSSGAAVTGASVVLVVAASLGLGADVGTLQRGRPVLISFALGAAVSATVLLWLT